MRSDRYDIRRWERKEKRGSGVGGWGSGEEEEKSKKVRRHRRSGGDDTAGGRWQGTSERVPAWREQIRIEK